MLDPKYSINNITPSSSTDLVSIAQLINSHSEYQSDICIEDDGLNLEYCEDYAQSIEEIRDLLFIPMKSIIKNLIEYYSSILLAVDPERSFYGLL